MEKTTIPRNPFTVDWLFPSPKILRAEKTEHVRRGLRLCRILHGRGLHLPAGCEGMRQLRVTSSFRRGGAELCAVEAAAGIGRGAAQGRLGAARHGGRAPDAHDLAGPEGGR